MLSAPNRLRRAEDFSRITKTGYRASSSLLVVYFLAASEPPSKVGLIINKSVGGSVSRHRIARQIRHLMINHIQTLPNDTHIVIRVLKKSDDYRLELETIMIKVAQRVGLRL